MPEIKKKKVIHLEKSTGTFARPGHERQKEYIVLRVYVGALVDEKAREKDKLLISMAAMVARRRLERLGVRSISGGEYCTVADPVRFFSHRRDRQTGRMVALLWRSSVRI